jgi:hypothetical protein
VDDCLTYYLYRESYSGVRLLIPPKYQQGLVNGTLHYKIDLDELQAGQYGLYPFLEATREKIHFVADLGFKQAGINETLNGQTDLTEWTKYLYIATREPARRDFQNVIIEKQPFNNSCVDYNACQTYYYLFEDMVNTVLYKAPDEWKQATLSDWGNLSMFKNDDTQRAILQAPHNDTAATSVVYLNDAGRGFGKLSSEAQKAILDSLIYVMNGGQLNYWHAFDNK